MKYWYGDMMSLLDEDSEKLILITTNGFIKTNGECVMGRGIAAQMRRRFPSISRELGRKIKKDGNIFQIVYKYKLNYIGAFPVKPITAVFNGSNAVDHMRDKFTVGNKVPGWACKADLEIIEQSLIALVAACKSHSLPSAIPVYIPSPGCGAGELDWKTQVEPLMVKHLKDLDHIYVCDFNKQTKEN